jgi:CRP/FNR family transcriptional regulator, dissimilatory nitrate respiration regulator
MNPQLTADEKLRALTALPLLADFDPVLLQLIANITIQRSYQPGEYVFMEGEPCLGLYIVEEGWLRAIKSNVSGREQVIRYVGPGDTFNEVGVLTDGINLVSVETLEPTTLFIVLRQAFLDLLDHYPALSKAVIQNLTARILHAMNLIVDLSLHSVEGRLARYLLDQATGDYVYRQKWATQAAIASYLGTRPVVINRVFRAFVENGLIVFEKNRIYLSNRAELQNIAMKTD